MKRLTKLVALDFGYLFALPFSLLTYALVPVVGRARALQLAGGQLTRVGAWLGAWFVPTMRSPHEFASFRRRIKRNISSVGQLWQMRVEREEPDLIEFRFHHCPVSTALGRLGVPELRKYACAADWVVAKRNYGIYSFRRDQTIGTGGAYCNHTYSRYCPAAPRSEARDRAPRASGLGSTRILNASGESPR